MAYTNNNTQGSVPTSAVDVVAVFDSNLKQLFPNARAMKAYTNPETRLMKHPLETGASIIEFKVALPVQIELYLFIGEENLKETYQQISQIYNSNTPLTVTTRVGTFANQLIQAMPSEETPDIYGSVLVTLRMEQVQFFSTNTSNISPLYAQDSDTVNRGQISPVTAQQFENSFYDGWGV